MPAESRRVLIDTSAFAALANRSDANHRTAVAIWEQLRRARLVPFTTNFIVAETHALLVARAGHATARSWLRALPVGETWISENDYVRGRQIVESHRDKSYTLTDSTSFVVMERLGTRLAFAFDEHFSQYGFQQLLPEGDVMR